MTKDTNDKHLDFTKEVDCIKAYQKYQKYCRQLKLIVSEKDGVLIRVHDVGRMLIVAEQNKNNVAEQNKNNEINNNFTISKVQLSIDHRHWFESDISRVADIEQNQIINIGIEEGGVYLYYWSNN